VQRKFLQLEETNPCGVAFGIPVLWVGAVRWSLDIPGLKGRLERLQWLSRDTVPRLEEEDFHSQLLTDCRALW
jgi:hypothetical protein